MIAVLRGAHYPDVARIKLDYLVRGSIPTFYEKLILAILVPFAKLLNYHISVRAVMKHLSELAIGHGVGWAVGDLCPDV